MNNKFLADIQIIKNAINANKLVVFAGAGISVDAKVPTWTKLIDKIKNELDLPEDERDFLKIAQIYFNDRSEKEYVEKVRDILGYKKQRYNEIHEEIFELSPEHIFTTNFDDLLEQVISKNSLPYSIIREDKDLPYSSNTKLLLKIHGDLALGNIVFKEDDYLSYSHDHPLLDSFMKATFSSKVVLFVGYSFNDYNLKQIVQYVRGILGKNFQNAYLLSVDKNIHESHRVYLKNKGINVINYYDANYTIIENGNTIVKDFILDFLERDNVYGEKSNFLKIVNALSDKGQILLNFLRFIRFYDTLKISITEDNVIQQLFTSLNRFEELKCLPQDFVSKLYPFKTETEYEYLIQYNALLLKNQHLANLFFNKISINNGEIISETLKEKEKEKVNFILTKLNNSSIFFVDKEREQSDSFGFKGFSDKLKSISLISSAKCDCSKSKYDRYELKQSLVEVNSYNISDTTEIGEDMEKAYLNYKFGNYHNAFRMFEEIASKAWNTQKFLTYYIAKVNIKALRSLLNTEFHMEEAERKSVLQRIDEIDIDKLLFQIPYKSLDELNLLKIIRDDKVIERVRDKIDEYYNKILETYTLYQNPYSMSFGPYYPQLVYFELYKLLSFYNENYIICDEFEDFKNVVNKGAEALIINYATNNRYGGKIKEFEDDFFELIIPYLDTDKFFKILGRYKIENIKFKKDNLDKVLEYSNNFFESYYDNEKFFHRESINEVIEAQLNKYRFSLKTTQIFNNIILFLSLIDLDKEQFNSVKKKIFPFLKYDKKLFGRSIDYLKAFIERNYDNLNIDDCKKLFEIFQSKHFTNERYGILEFLGNICYSKKFEIIDNIDYSEKIYSDIKYIDNNLNGIVYLWAMSSLEIKEKIKIIIIETLRKKFDVELYKTACSFKVIDFNLFFLDFINYMNDMNKNNDLKKDGYDIEGGLAKYTNFTFLNSLIFIYSLGIDSNDIRLKKLKNLHEYMKFGIFRENYQFEKFKIEWLHLFNRSIFYKEFNKIKPLKKIIESSLRNNYDEELSKIFGKYFI